MKKARPILNILLVSLLAAGAVILVVYLASRESGRGEPEDTFHSPTVYAMDTVLDITIQGRSERQAKADADAAVALARKIEDETSQFKPGSDVARINDQAGAGPVKVSDDTLLVVRTALEYSGRMNGAFDVTIAPVVRLWGFYDQKFRVPSDEEVARTPPLVGYGKVIVDEGNGTVMLAEKGMALDLGGIAKGYAVGRMYELLRRRGVEHALINFGGAVGALGTRSDGKDWVIGIKDPRGSGGDLAGELEIKDRFVSSSGDYERYFVKDGMRYFHIFDPATGRNPSGVVSTTVVGPDAMLTDTLTKILVMGRAAGLEFMKTLPEYQALMIDSAGKTYTTPNMKSMYRIRIEEKI